jgi:hypothetical protein
MKPSSLYQCSHRFAIIILEAIQETIGPASYKALVLRSGLQVGDDPPTNFSFQELRRAFEHDLDPASVDGIFLRAGRSAYCHFLRQFANETGFGNLEFRLLPTQKRILTGLNTLANILNSECDGAIRVSVENGQWTWTDTNCVECAQEKREKPVSHFMTGFLQEYLSWISGGRIYQIDEMACRSCGDPACVVVINQIPLD